MIVALMENKYLSLSIDFSVDNEHGTTVPRINFEYLWIHRKLFSILRRETTVKRYLLLS